MGAILKITFYFFAFCFLIAFSFYGIIFYLAYLFLKYIIPKIMSYIKKHSKNKNSNSNSNIVTDHTTQDNKHELSYFETYFNDDIDENYAFTTETKNNDGYVTDTFNSIDYTETNCIDHEENITDTIDKEVISTTNDQLSDCSIENKIPTSYEINTEDEAYEICKLFVLYTQKASTSLLQRKFRIMYNEAARIIDRLEKEGIIGPQLGSKPREVYIKPYTYNEDNTIDFDKYTFNNFYTLDEVNKLRFNIVSSYLYLEDFYHLIEKNAPISKEELKEKCDLTEYLFNYSIDILLNNNAIYYHINKLCINDNYRFTFQIEISEEFEILKKIYDTDKYKEFQNIKEGIEFECYLSKLLKEHSYETTLTPKSNDYGADILATRDNIKYVIQCKFYTKPVGIQAVQEVLGAKRYYDSNLAIVATNNTFTNQANM